MTGDQIKALIVSGNDLEDRGDLAQAIAQYKRAVELDPRHAAALLNLGNGYYACNDFDQAEYYYRQSLSVEDGASANQNLANVYWLSSRWDEALRHANRASELKPGWPAPVLLCAQVLIAQGERAAGKNLLEQLIQSNANDAVANCLLGAELCREFGGVDERGLNLMLRAAELAPGDEQIAEQLAQAQYQAGNFAAARHLLHRAQNTGDPLAALTLMGMVSLADPETDSVSDLARLRERVQHLPTPPRWARSPHKPLRVGFLSGDFRRHPIACFIAPILAALDRTVVTTWCLSNNPLDDAMTALIKSRSDHWVDVRQLSDEALQRLCHKEELDILVDLSGLTNEHRYSAVARRLAPIQLGWLGYLGSAANPGLDYRLVDNWTDPPGLTDSHHSEQLLRLPRTQWCYESLLERPAPKSAPYLRNHYLTFGSFNQDIKLNEVTLKCWAELLQRFSNSRLNVVGVKSAWRKNQITPFFAAANIDLNRVQILERLSIEAYQNAVAGVDIALDSFPYNGATTTIETLLAGVPVATVRGHRSVARGGHSILSAAGLSDWVAQDAHSLADVVANQVKHGGDWLHDRSQFAQHVRAGPLCDARDMARHLESLFQAITARTDQTRHIAPPTA